MDNKAIFASGAFVGAAAALLFARNSSVGGGGSKRANSAREGAVAPNAEVPMDLRRTTLVVDDIDNSLRYDIILNHLID